MNSAISDARAGEETTADERRPDQEKHLLRFRQPRQRDAEVAPAYRPQEPSCHRKKKHHERREPHHALREYGMQRRAHLSRDNVRKKVRAETVRERPAARDSLNHF